MRLSAAETIVCVGQVCSAYLGIHDNDRRLADHFGGKLHLGFIRIREKLAELEKPAERRREERRKARSDRDEDRYRERERSHFVGGRELDRRSRRHRSRSKDRRRPEPAIAAATAAARDSPKR